MDAIAKLLGYGLTDRLFVACLAIYALTNLDPASRIELAWPIAFLASAVVVSLTFRPSSARKLADKAADAVKRLAGKE